MAGGLKAWADDRLRNDASGLTNRPVKPAARRRRTQTGRACSEALVARPNPRTCVQPPGSEQVTIDIANSAAEKFAAVGESQNFRIVATSAFGKPSRAPNTEPRATENRQARVCRPHTGARRLPAPPAGRQASRPGRGNDQSMLKCRRGSNGGGPTAWGRLQVRLRPTRPRKGPRGFALDETRAYVQRVSDAVGVYRAKSAPSPEAGR